MITVDLDSNTATINDAEVPLTPQMAVIMHCLVKRKVARKDWLYASLWGDSEPDSAGATVCTQICMLRKRLRPHGVGIESRYATGYSLVTA